MFDNVPFFDDIVVIQYFQLLNQLVQLRLISKEACKLKFKQLIHFLVHPNS